MAFNETSVPQAVEGHRRGVIAYLYDRVLRASSTLQATEQTRIMHENTLKQCLKSFPTPVAAKEAFSTFQEPLSAISSAYHEHQTDAYFAFLAPHWIKVPVNGTKQLLAEPLPVSAGVLPAPDDATVPEPRFAAPPSPPTKPLRHSPRNRYRSDSRARSRPVYSHRDEEPPLPSDSPLLDFTANLRNDAQQLLKAREEKQAEHAPLTQVLSTLAEVQSIMDVFATEVLQQTELCENINLSAETSVGHIVSASKELTKAAERRRYSYRYYILLFYCCASLLVLFCDFLTSSRWI